MCAYVCVYSSLPHVFLASGLALSPRLMIGSLPPVMSWCAQCWNEKAAVLPCSWVFLSACAGVFSFVGEARFLVIRSFETCPPWFSALSNLGRELKLFHPSCFQGKATGNVSFGKGVWWLDCIVQQLCNTKIDVFLPCDLFYLLPSFLPVAHIPSTHLLSVASVDMQ